MALQRLQEQEREMQMRFEQQKQLTQMRQMQTYGGYNQVLQIKFDQFMLTFLKVLVKDDTFIHIRVNDI